MVKLAGSTGKRAYAVIRQVAGRYDFVPCYMSNELSKIDDYVQKQDSTNKDKSLGWSAFVLLDNGDWHPVDDNIRNYCK